MCSAVKIAAGVGCGILAAIAISIITCAGCIAVNMRNISDTENKALSHIEIEDIKGEMDSDSRYVRITGKVRNTGNTGVSYVKVGVDLLDKNDTVVDTDWTYAVSSESLQPGAAKSFDILVPKDKRMKKFNCYVIAD